MRRALLVLGVIVMVALGAVPSATSLAAKSKARAHARYSLVRVGTRPMSDQSSGWTMVKPIVPVTTRMVVPHNTVTGTAVARLALRYVGYRYTLVGNSPSLGFSCIGLVSYVYQTLGIPLPDELGNARAFAPPVALNALRTGDILWFGNTVWPGLSHVAIYLGHGRFVHAAWFNRGVITSSLRNDPVDGNYWIDHYLGASRPWGGALPGLAALPTTVQAIPGVPAVMVIVPKLNLRRWWSLHAPVRQVVGAATPLNVVRHSGHWYQVMTPDGMRGWIASARLAAMRTARLVRHSAHHRLRHPQARRWRAARIVAWWRSKTSSAVTHPVWSLQSRHVRRRRAQGRKAYQPTVRRTVRHWRLQAHSAWSPVHRWQLVLLVVHVRSAPTIHARVMGLMMPKRHVRVVARHGAWKRVRLANGRIGYVYGKYLR